MIKSRHDTAFFQRSYSSGSSHGIRSFTKIFSGYRGRGLGMTPDCFAKKIRSMQQSPV
ncbi:MULTISPECIES: hypothetical protein [unclassified Rickettsia]|uniref:hypothetical protein n=1 Tax=unclassified Rickettsia TaxID=114295 RepID=UPI0031334B1F